MTQNIESVRSPCVGNCCLDGDDVCLGCFRHIEEIKSWGLADDSERLRIIQAAQLRSGHHRLDNIEIT